MLVSLVRFELVLHLRQIAFRASALVFGLMGLLLSMGTSGGAKVFQDAPTTLGFFVGMLSLGSYLVIALLTGSAILRDSEHKMEGIIYATGLTHAHYVLSRFIGLVLAASFCFAMGVLSLYLGRFLPGQDPSRFGSMSPIPYIYALVWIGLPNVLLGCAVIFSAAALTRSSMTTYLSGVALYALYFIGSILGNSPIMAQSKPLAQENAQLAALLEPMGLVALMDEIRYWSIDDKNTRLLPVEGALLHNRLLWIGAALMLFALTYHLYRFRSPASPRKTWRKPRQSEATRARVTYHPLLPNQVSFGRSWAGLVSHTRICVKSMVRSLPFLGLFVLWIPFHLINLKETLSGGDFNIPFQPWTEILIPGLIEPINLFGTLVVLFFSAEFSWRERSAGMDGLIDATPCPSTALQLGRLASMALLITALILTPILLAMLFQLGQKPGPDLLLYLSLFPRCGLPLLGLAALCLAIHTLTTHKYTGLALSAVFTLGFTGIIPKLSVIPWSLARFGSTPEYLGSPMAGSFNDTSLVFYLLLWTSIAAAVTAASIWLLKRGLQRQRRMGLAAKWVLAISLALSLGTGFSIYNKTYLQGSYLDKDALLNWQAQYERKYAQLEQMANPEITALQLKVDLLPQQRSLTLSGTLEFENRTKQALANLNLGLDRRLRQCQLKLEGARLEAHDPRFQQFRYRLSEPLAVGAKGKLSFSVSLTSSAFDTLDPEAYILPEGSYVELDKLLPYFGFSDRNLIASVIQRHKRGLAPRQTFPAAAPQDANANWVDMDIEYATALGQTVVATGKLERSWQQAGRAYFHYVSTRPLPLGIAAASAIYEQRQLKSEPFQVNVYYHKGHESALDGLLKGAQDALQAYSSRFGAYPDDYLNIAEIPAFSDSFGATSYANTIFVVENRVFLLDQDPELQEVSYRTMAHEVGHQWWGWQLDPAVVSGYKFLTETMAEYCELTLCEAEFGQASNQQYLDWTKDLYFYIRGVAGSPEQSLSAVQFEPYVYYFKGAQAANALKQLLGVETMDRVLRDFMAERRYPEKPIASELAARLEAAAPAEAREAVHEWLNQVVSCDLQLIEAQAITQAEGLLVDLQINLRRYALDANGKAQLLPPGSWLEVAFSKDGVQDIQRVWLPDHETSLQLKTALKADQVQLDPRGLLLVQPLKTQNARLEVK